MSGSVSLDAVILPFVPLDEYGTLEPEDLSTVLSADFYLKFSGFPWAQQSVAILELASHHYLHVFRSWHRTPQANAPIPNNETDPPTIHDVLEALLILRRGTNSYNHDMPSWDAPSVESHARLQSLLNRLPKVGYMENQHMHDLHRRYPWLTLSTTEQMVRKSQSDSGTPGSDLSPITVDVRAMASDQMKKLDELEHRTKRTEQRKTQLIWASLLSFASTIASFIILYELKLNR
jgi:hypothetical protein